MTNNTDLILPRTAQRLPADVLLPGQEADVGSMMLEYEREQAKRVRRQVLPCDRTYVRRQVNDDAIILLNEMRKAGPCTAKYLAEKLTISTHKSANLIKSLTSANLAEKICLTVRGHVQKGSSKYRTGARERNDCWVYQAVAQ